MTRRFPALSCIAPLMQHILDRIGGDSDAGFNPPSTSACET
jgi:hypothetical protein